MQPRVRPGYSVLDARIAYVESALATQKVMDLGGPTTIYNLLTNIGNGMTLRTNVTIRSPTGIERRGVEIDQNGKPVSITGDAVAGCFATPGG